MYLFYTSTKGQELTRVHDTDAGWDISNGGDSISVAPGKTAVLETGIHIYIPIGTFGKVEMRSGLAFKHGMATLAGVIDAGYTGEIMVKVINHGENPVEIWSGMRFAQLIIHHISIAKFTLTDMKTYTGLVENADRGDNGFGSSTE
jgi:dUTP pyrophosphatase